MRQWLVNTKQTITATGFADTDWESVEHCLHHSPHLLHLWATKHVSGFCATNACLHHRDKTHSPVCPICKLPTSIETTRHILHCSSPLITPIWNEAVDNLRTSLQQTKTHPELQDAIISYVRHRGSRTFHQLAPTPNLSALATSQDDIGWDNFLEGKISYHFRNYQHRYYSTHHPHRSIINWTSNLVKNLLLTSHRLWSFRNEIVHQRTKDGLLIQDAKRLKDKFVLSSTLIRYIYLMKIVNC